MKKKQVSNYVQVVDQLPRKMYLIIKSANLSGVSTDLSTANELASSINAEAIITCDIGEVYVRKGITKDHIERLWRDEFN